jgi:hypothetical protein
MHEIHPQDKEHARRGVRVGGREGGPAGFAPPLPIPHGFEARLGIGDWVRAGADVTGPPVMS